MIRTLWDVVACGSRLIDAARQAWLRPSPRLERLINHGRAAWRRRWLGMATAWLLCLLGWAAVVLPPGHYRSSALLFAEPGPGVALTSHASAGTAAALAALQSALSTPAARARAAAAAPASAASDPPAAAADLPGELAARIAIAVEAPALFRVSYLAERPDVAQRALQTLVELVTTNPPPVPATAPATPARPTGPAADAGPEARAAAVVLLQASQDQAAALRDDLAAALLQRDARARQLAEVPPVLAAGRPNPIYEQIALQLGQQETLIAGLRSQLAAIEAEIARLEQQRAPGSGDLAAPRDRSRPPEAAGDPGRPVFRLVHPPGWPGAPEGAPRPLLLAAVLTAGIVVGTAAAAGCGRLDGTIDGARQLERRFRLPVLGMIATPWTAGQQRRRRRAAATLGLAGFGLIGLFGALASAETLDLLAPLAERLRSSSAS